jgi:hypothetical protein
LEHGCGFCGEEHELFVDPSGDGAARAAGR